MNFYSKEDLEKLVEEIENDETYSDLDINERTYVIYKLLRNTEGLIADYMVDTDEDEKYREKLRKAVKLLYEIMEGEF